MQINMMQRQLKLNSCVIQGLCEELVKLKDARRVCYKLGVPDDAKICTQFIRKFEKKLAKMNEMQKALKAELKEAYWWAFNMVELA
jgi:hypothetical protein